MLFRVTHFASRSLYLFEGKKEFRLKKPSNGADFFNGFDIEKASLTVEHEFCENTKSCLTVLRGVRRVDRFSVRIYTRIVKPCIFIGNATFPAPGA